MSKPIKDYIGEKVTVRLKVREGYGKYHLKRPKYFKREYSGVLEQNIPDWYNVGNVFFSKSIASHIKECT